MIENMIFSSKKIYLVEMMLFRTQGQLSLSRVFTGLNSYRYQKNTPPGSGPGNEFFCFGIDLNHLPGLKIFRDLNLNPV